MLPRVHHVNEGSVFSTLSCANKDSLFLDWQIERRLRRPARLVLAQQGQKGETGGC